MFCLQMRDSFSRSFSPCSLQVAGGPVFVGGFFCFFFWCPLRLYSQRASSGSHSLKLTLTIKTNYISITAGSSSLLSALLSHTRHPGLSRACRRNVLFCVCVEASIHTHIPSVSIPRSGRRCTRQPHMCPPCVGSHNNWRVWRHTGSPSLPRLKEWLTRSRRV